MKNYAPLYYKDFRCIADRCEHICCIGWRFSLDDATYEGYKSASGTYSQELRDHLSCDEDGPYIPSDASGRCPHLDGRGLCRVISNCGEEYLCEICREHPRFYNSDGNRLEVGLGASCPEAARLILEGPISLELTPHDEGAKNEALSARADIKEVIAECEDYAECEKRIAKLAGIPAAVLSDGFRRDALCDLEYLNTEDRELISEASDPTADSEAMKRILSYFLYRHLNPETESVEIASVIGFALFSTRSVGAAAAKVGFTEALRIYSAEIEYSPTNTEDIIFDIEFELA